MRLRLPSAKLLVMIGAIVALLVGAGQSYRRSSAPRATASVIRRWTQPRYDARAQKMMDEHCLELAYAIQGQPQRASYCSWEQHLSNELLIRFDPEKPSSVEPDVGNGDWIVTPVLWSVGSFLGWLALVLFVYLPLYDRFGSHQSTPRRRQRR